MKQSIYPTYKIVKNSSCLEDRIPVGGLTKREYFAGEAMQGLISSDDYLEIGSAKELAKIAVSHADALIEELAK